jgi:hypothetical protein
VRHPRLAVVIGCALLAGVIVVCGLQLSYGTYLGRGWVIAAMAGMAIAAGVSAWALISIRRHGGVLSGAVVTWLVLGLVSGISDQVPVPAGSLRQRSGVLQHGACRPAGVRGGDLRGDRRPARLRARALW